MDLHKESLKFYKRGEGPYATILGPLFANQPVRLFASAVVE